MSNTLMPSNGNGVELLVAFAVIKRVAILGRDQLRRHD